MTEDELRREYGQTLVDNALKRDVRRTQYGWRVGWDLKLDGPYELDHADWNESGKPRAYWPKERNGKLWCRCRWGRSNRMCSHLIAVLLKDESLQP